MIALLSIAACDKAENRSDVRRSTVEGDIILITIDTLRYDHMSIYGYPRTTTPNIERLFGEHVIYERTYATESNTPSSVASILSGLLPQEHGVRLFAQLLKPGVRIIPDFLATRYQTAAFVANWVLTDEAMGFGDRFEHFDDYVADLESARNVYERSARKTTDAALNWLRSRRDPSRPLFLWIHYIDPHGPYDAPEEWPRSFTHETERPISVTKIPGYMIDGTDALDYIDAYDEEIAYVDEQIGRLLDGFAELSPLDQALVILSADHGETLLEHERYFSHGYHVYEELIRVPLMIRAPGLKGARFAESVSTIDIWPTILTHADIPAPDVLHGIDLMTPGAPNAERVHFAEARSGDGQWRAAVNGDEKFMAYIVAGDAGASLTRNRLFDLRADPFEQNPLIWPQQDARAVRELRRLIDLDPDPAGQPQNPLRGSLPEGPKIAPGASKSQIEALRSLGYVD